MRDRGEARAHRVEKEKWELEAGGGGRGAGAPRSARASCLLRPRPVRPQPRGASLDPPRSGSGRRGALAARRMWPRTRLWPRAPWRWALALLTLGGAGLCHAGPQPMHPARPGARNK